MKSLFSPRSIAVIGASRDKSKVGSVVLKNHLDSGYKGKIYAVNPKAKKVQGVKCYPSVTAIGKPVDLAIVCVPARFVAAVIKECIACKVPSAVILSSGFGESGPEGRAREEELRQIISESKIRVIGPNCLGIATPTSGINTSFVSKLPLEGSVAFISQSGAMCSAILDWSFEQGFGFSSFVSIGNKVDLTEADLLYHLADDKKTKVILLYIEGLKDGRAFMKAASYASSKKPILALKAGRTDAGAHAAMSHTGSLTGSDDVYDAAFRQCGVLRVDNTRELFDIGLALSELKAPKNNKVAIVTNSGGPGILASDATALGGFDLSELSKATQQKLRSFLPPQASIHNPVDVIGDADVERYAKALGTVVRDKDVGSVLALMCPQKMVDMGDIATAIASASKRSKLPIVGCFMGGNSMTKGRDTLKASAIPHYDNPEDAIRVLEGVAHYHHELKKNTLSSRGPIKGKRTPSARLLSDCTGESLDPPAGMKLLSHYGISLNKPLLAKSITQAELLAKKLKYPVVLKIASPDILHKSDVGGVRVGIANEKELADAYGEILRSVKQHKPRAHILGITLEKMVTGKEVIAGVTRDPQFGPVLTFGLGGVYVEVLKDVSRRVLPITKTQAKEMILEINAAAILTGTRGEQGVALDKLADTLVRLGQIALDHDIVDSIEINPLVATPHSVTAIDVLCTLKKT